MVPNSLTHIILVSFRMQKKKKKKPKHTIQNTKCINSPHPTPCPITHTYCDASWNTEKPRHKGGGRAECAEGAELCVVRRQKRPRPRGTLQPPSLPPRPTHIQANVVLTYTTLPDMLKPVVPGGWKGKGREGEGRTYWGHGWGGGGEEGKGGTFCREPQGVRVLLGWWWLAG